MASISRSPAIGVTLAGAVFRAIVDLALDSPHSDAQVADLLTQLREVGSIGLDLVEPPLQQRVEVVLTEAAERAANGERSNRSGRGEAIGERLIAGGELALAFLRDAPPSTTPDHCGS